ncbi:hypothetical protein, partial [Klebsiella pneumoniae]
ESVESIAVYNDFITFETLGKLNVNSLFDDIGISVFGDKLAAAERLIRIGADTVLNIRKKHGVVIAMHDSNAYAIEPADEQELRKHREEYESFRAERE